MSALRRATPSITSSLSSSSNSRPTVSLTPNSRSFTSSVREPGRAVPS
jgi:hypothetical protein